MANHNNDAHSQENATQPGTEQPRALSQHLLTILEQEKANLARELHDELGSNLTIMRINLTTALEKFGHEDPGLANHLQETLQLLKKTVDIKRRIIENLHPSMLEDFGLAISIRSYCEEMAACSGLQIDTMIEGDFTQLDTECAITFYRIIQESLTNIVKYAHATHVSISLKQSQNEVNLCISDNGVGISQEALKKPKTQGIFGMRERAVLNGGSFDISTNKDGTGTCIKVTMPCTSS
jgi:signal transduction histidine kinase